MKRRRLFKNLRREITFMIIPHHSTQPLRIKLSVFLMSFLVLVVSGMGGLTVFIITRHINYFQTREISKNLKSKNEYFGQEIIKVRGLAADLEEMEKEVLLLLKLRPKSPKNVSEYQGQGGGSILEDPLPLTREEFKQNLALLKEEAKGRKENFTTIKTTPLIWPTEGRITSGYGYRINPFSGRREFHPAVDIANVSGTPIKAPADGVVFNIEWDRTFGKFLTIRHREGISTRFAHCGKILVKKGERVSRGQTIALMGDTGLSTGSHLHYEIWVKNKRVNPWQYMCLKMTDDEEGKEMELVKQEER